MLDLIKAILSYYVSICLEHFLLTSFVLILLVFVLLKQLYVKFKKKMLKILNNILILLILMQ